MVDPAIRPAWHGARVCGPAAHGRVPARRQPDAAHRRRERAARRRSSSRPSAATCRPGAWGEILTEAARARGVAGLVIDGAVRDIDAIEALRFPVFSRGPRDRLVHEGAGRAAAMVRFSSAALTVRPGDLIFGNADGVVVIEQDRIDDVYEAAVRRRETRVRDHQQASRGPDDDGVAGAERPAATRRTIVGDS